MITLTDEEALEIYNTVVEWQQFLHQPMNYERPEQVLNFAHKHYRKVHNVLYNILCKWGIGEDD